MSTTEIAILGGGCFWCLEAVYDEIEGVLSVESGYMGGHLENPDYQAVCTGETGHVEVVRVTFDSEVTSYREILEIFFAIHDPTSRDRQGEDAGPQYRSVVFHHGARQRAVAEELIGELSLKGIWPAPIVTEVRPASTFYPAEGYHQEYFRNHPQQPYCASVVAPKVRKFREKFSSKLRRRT